MAEFERLKREFGWNISEHATLENNLWICSRKDVSYPESGHDACASVEDRSFWFSHRNLIISDMLRAGGIPSALWEIGSGNGFVSRYLQQQGIEVVAIEPGKIGAERAMQRGVPSICGLLEDLHLPDNSIPAIGCFDVLEHLEHPDVLLGEFHRILAPGGFAAISVPAFSFLWSQMDNIAGHYRRYRRGLVDKMMTDTGFERRQSRYMMFSMTVPVLLLRALPYRLGLNTSTEEGMNAATRQLEEKRGVLGAAMKVLFAVERMTSPILPCGTSVVGIYEKK